MSSSLDSSFYSKTFRWAINPEVNMGIEGFSEYQKLETDKNTVEMYYDFLREFVKSKKNR